MFHLLDTLPSFPANLTYQSTSPMITGFTPKVYAQQPWLGLHSLDLAHTPPPDSHRKAEDVLKEAILHSTGGNAATAVSTGPSTSTSTAPKQTRQDADELPWEGIPSTSSPTAHSPTKQMCQVSFSMHTHGPVLPLLAGAQCLIMDQDEVPQACQAHQAQVPDLAVAVGPVMGPQHGPKPVDTRDLSTHEQHQMEVSKSSLQMRPVEVRRMSWTLPMRQMSHKGVCPCLTSPLQMMRTLTNARHVNSPAKMILTSAWRDKLIRDGVVGIQEWDKTVHDYADPGKRRPKNPDTIGPPISYMKEPRGVSAPSIHDKSFGVMSFLSHRPIQFVYTYASKTTHHCGPSQQSPGSRKSQHWPYIIVVFQGGPITPLGLLQELHSWHVLACIFQSSCLMKPRTGTSHGYHVAHSVPIPSKMIQHTSTTSSAPITMQTSCVGHV